MTTDDNGSIYLIRCLETGKGYVGQYSKPEPNGRWVRHIQDAKKGSKYLIHQAIRKYGDQAFTFEKLCNCAKGSLGNMEAYYAEQLETYCWDFPGGYNMVWCGTQPRLGIKNSPEMCANISKANKGRKCSPEHIEKISAAKLGKKLSPEALEAHHKAHLGRTKSPEEIEKLRVASTGKKQTPETIAKAQQNRTPTDYTPELREKFSQVHRGRIATEEARQHMSEAQTGRKHSDETIAKMKEVHKGKAYCKGIPKSEEWKEKMRKPKTEEHKEKLRLARLAYLAKKREEQSRDNI